MNWLSRGLNIVVHLGLKNREFIRGTDDASLVAYLTGGREKTRSSYLRQFALRSFDKKTRRRKKGWNLTHFRRFDDFLG